MAKCDLSIELDDPDAIYLGGDKISGVVRVNVDKNVATKGLVVSSGWATHGRGNVTSGEFKSTTLFTGEWRAGDKAEYRFELPVGNWPPSYHGGYLNIDHAISAKAKIAWAFDPKASKNFLMRPTGTRQAEELTEPAAMSKVGCVFLAIFVGGFFPLFFGGMFAAGGFPVILFFGLPILLLGGSIYGAKVWLPRYYLGDVECTLEPLQVSPGDQVRGELVFKPRKQLSINEIKLTFKASEKVVSGSGSNRTTHRNVFFEKEQTLVGETTLQAGQEKRIPLSVEMPSDAPYSVKLTDNELIWSTLVRIDIPRWPDWKKEIAIAVVPSGKQTEKVAKSTSPIRTDSSAAATDAAEHVGPSAITFAETAQHFWDLKDDRDSVNDLAEAVSGLTFDVDAFVERRLLYSGDDDPHLFEDGYAVWAHYTDPQLPMVLYVPHHLADEFEQIGRDLWKGRGTIVGWDDQHRRLQVKLESSGV